MANSNPYQVRKWVHRFQMLYLWLIRTLLFFLPNSNLFMRIRGSLYRPVFKSCGPGFKVANDVVINAPQKIELGSNVYFAVGCVISGGGTIKIGDNVLFGPKNLVIANNHAFNGTHYREL
ncbi:MAG TPA: hypothetical protein DCP28_12620, partial [Cytophagales bacterium]|nr:hypothetical protein [Cytophagales bacterium]